MMNEITVKKGMVYQADNRDVLSTLDSQSVDLIYIDPPFNSNRNYTAPNKSEAAGASFKDIWAMDDENMTEIHEIMVKSSSMYSVIKTADHVYGQRMTAYLIMMAVRLIEMKRILKDTGSIYLHCDPTASHYLKILMDALFGKKNFRNEIIWCYNKWTNTAKCFQKNTDSILFYSKQNNYTFNKPVGNMTEPMKQIRKRGYNGGTDNKGIPILRVYDRTNPKAQKQITSGKYKQIYYIDEPAEGAPLKNWWTDIPALKGNERNGYPTQKPLKLLERIIKASSKEGDTVLDPFCGSGTTLIAADKLNRKWIGIDNSPEAIKIIKKRFA